MNKTSAETLAKDIFNFAMQHGVPDLDDAEGLRQFQEALRHASGNWKTLEQATETAENQASIDAPQQQAQLFVAVPETPSQASMKAPIFSLSTREDLKVWKWASEDGKKSVEVQPSVCGRATQHNKDILIYCTSQLTEALNQKKASSKTVRFTAYDLLVATNRNVCGADYDRLKLALDRLAGTRIRTDIKTGGERISINFGLIDSWKITEKSPDDSRMVAIEVTLSDWLYNSIQAYEVLTIHPDYFRLRKPLERRLYEITRKHVGKQGVWKVGLEVLRSKASSHADKREFKRMIRDIVDADTIPEYLYQLSSDDMVTVYDRAQKRR